MFSSLDNYFLLSPLEMLNQKQSKTVLHVGGYGHNSPQSNNPFQPLEIKSFNISKQFPSFQQFNGPMANFATNDVANSKRRQIVVDDLGIEDKNQISLTASCLLKGTSATGNEDIKSKKNTFKKKYLLFSTFSKVSAFMYRSGQPPHNLFRFSHQVNYYCHCEKLIFNKTATRFYYEILNCYVLLLCW